MVKVIIVLRVTLSPGESPRGSRAPRLLSLINPTSTGWTVFLMTNELMPRLAQLTRVHGIILDGNDLVVQCATEAVDRADLQMPIAEALKLSEGLSRLPYSISLDTNEYSMTYGSMPQLAQLTKAHGVVVLDDKEVLVQCATATVEWTDIAIPIEEALRLRETFRRVSSFVPRKKGEKGEPERVLRFPRPINLQAILAIQGFYYRSNRYMQALTREELDQRLHDVAANVMKLRDDGKYTLIQPKRNGMHAPTRNIDFLLLYTELAEEFLIRGLLDGGGKSTNPPERIRRLSGESWCRRPDWENASQYSRESYLNKPKMLFKFGKAEHIRPLYERGEVFVKPASFFKVAEARLVKMTNLRCAGMMQAGRWSLLPATISVGVALPFMMTAYFGISRVTEGLPMHVWRSTTQIVS
ncbi:hypothetical protein [Bradyrhizobium sp. JYMT SZCCT0428]|uniref:hypothetical protein n=1 Tax=Bradyrhizobium sp. JYMT SZCCT0428 TaxID=2807673 RepID=UPI001BA61EC1|nr:hypothetical protein [Bradyrhizobium sp. JYMT SZCCT0428]MBR1154282.1 hypothetical protein [Bradyrhizobium sp. JYMT SZCCT0428]